MALSPITTAEMQSLESSYISNYAYQVTPMIQKNLRTNLPRASAEEIRVLADETAIKLANCQLKSLSHYPKKYWDLSVHPVANGKTSQEASDELNKVVGEDLKAGEITQAELERMSLKAQNKLKQCLFKTAAQAQ